jgi:hypothetical protein
MSSDNDKKQENEDDRLDFIKQYPIDFFEAFVTIIIIRAIIDKPINMFYVFKTSIVVGLLIYLVNLVGDNYKDNIREGIRNSIGYFIFNQFAT